MSEIVKSDGFTICSHYIDGLNCAIKKDKKKYEIGFLDGDSIYINIERDGCKHLTVSDENAVYDAASVVAAMLNDHKYCTDDKHGWLLYTPIYWDSDNEETDDIESADAIQCMIYKEEAV